MILKQLKFLADENISPVVVAFLRSIGADVLDVKEKGWFGKSDVEIISRATKEKRFILTHDLDFGELVFHQKMACYGIIILKLKNLKSKNVVQTLGYLLREHNLPQPRSILIVQEGLVRQRALPKVKRHKL